MKTLKKSLSAFTLVELLVVIVIISLTAMVTVKGIKGGRRQANAVKCQTNMKNLHTAVVAYFADNNCYPTAGSYERYSKTKSAKGGVTKHYSEAHGWVSWVRKDKKPRVDENGSTLWSEGGKPHASACMFVGTRSKDMLRAIEDGAIYKYAGRNFDTYRCPDHYKVGGENVYLAYSMNDYFFSEARRNYTNRNSSNMLRKEKETSKTETIPVDYSRLGLFIENDDNAGDDCIGATDGIAGTPGDSAGNTKVFVDDCIWRHSEEVGLFPHKKSGKTEASHVVFLDGHVESVLRDGAQGDDYKSAFKEIGEGTYNGMTPDNH